MIFVEKCGDFLPLLQTSRPPNMPSRNTPETLRNLLEVIDILQRLEISENYNRAQNLQICSASHPSTSKPRKSKRSAIYNSGLDGEEKVKELMDNPDRMYKILRVHPNEFNELCRTLVRKCHVKEWNLGCSIQLRLSVFLSTLAGNIPQRVTAENYQKPQPTISRIFNEIVLAINEMGLIFMPDEIPEVPERIKNDDRYYPFFKGCVGALDGTHTKFNAARVDQNVCRNRKGETTTNTLCIVNFERVILGLSTGNFGSSHDTAVLREAVEHGLRFPKDCYFLGDLGYPLSRRILTPYKGVRYHLKEFQGSGMEPADMKELFNLRHAQLRSVVERTFGVLKNRFRMTKENEYCAWKQSRIIKAACNLHNYLTLTRNRAKRLRNSTNTVTVSNGEQNSLESDDDDDYDYDEEDDDGYEYEYEDVYHPEDEDEVENVVHNGENESMNEPVNEPVPHSAVDDIDGCSADVAWRDEIAKALWDDYCKKRQLMNNRIAGVSRPARSKK